MLVCLDALPAVRVSSSSSAPHVLIHLTHLLTIHILHPYIHPYIHTLRHHHHTHTHTRTQKFHAPKILFVNILDWVALMNRVQMIGVRVVGIQAVGE